MNRILIKHFSNLNNYGTGMMGLIAIKSIVDNYGTDNIEIYLESNEYTNINEINNELPLSVNIKAYEPQNTINKITIKNKYFRKIITFINILCDNDNIHFDKIIILGGDDLSEFYSKYGTSIELFQLWKKSYKSQVILLGQTIGPFSIKINRIAFKLFSKRLNIVARDPWTVNYLWKEFKIPVKEIGDLAFANLPLQDRHNIENNILNEYKLTKDMYCTVVVSGLVKEGYYCNNVQIYLENYKTFILSILNNPSLKSFNVVLLAHTFIPYGDESQLIQSLYDMFSKNEKKRIILIKEKILPTKARFILGNGFFTITGRMHPAVSTFQMCKPAIVLSYSPKYTGVIGDSLNRHDLIINAKDANLWINGDIANQTINKIEYILANYNSLINDISIKINYITNQNSQILNLLIK